MESLNPIVSLYRTLNPRSRAVDHTTLYGSGSRVRRRTCIYCRRVVATSCGDWPETAVALNAAHGHAEKCAPRYVAANVGRLMSGGASRGEKTEKDPGQDQTKLTQCD